MASLFFFLPPSVPPHKKKPNIYLPLLGRSGCKIRLHSIALLMNCGFTFCVRARAAASTVGGSVLGMARIMVTPPASAALVHELQSSLWVAPGSRTWTWTSIRPANKHHHHHQSDLQTNIIINPLTARVVGAPQMILQPVFSIFPSSPLPSGTYRTPGLSIPWCCLPNSSFVRLVFFPLSLCLARWFWPDLMNRRHDHTTAVCISLRSSGDLHVVKLPAGS